MLHINLAFFNIIWFHIIFKNKYLKISKIPNIIILWKNYRIYIMIDMPMDIHWYIYMPPNSQCMSFNNLIRNIISDIIERFNFSCLTCRTVPAFFFSLWMSQRTYINFNGHPKQCMMFKLYIQVPIRLMRAWTKWHAKTKFINNGIIKKQELFVPSKKAASFWMNKTKFLQSSSSRRKK